MVVWRVQKLGILSGNVEVEFSAKRIVNRPVADQKTIPDIIGLPFVKALLYEMANEHVAELCYGVIGAMMLDLTRYQHPKNDPTKVITVRPALALL